MSGLRFDWAGLLRAGLAPLSQGGAGLHPQAFWQLTPLELRLMLGRGAGAMALTRAGLAALMADYPDTKERGDAGPGEPECRTGAAGDRAE
ncbi:rcc01693 family protein [Falsigemmobacter faecalis]|uniref:Phage tail assembly chaperone n=1 Tax=Falsigemmobacter faecalis TaxID=2488730 RepID=A0A3P3DT24_9RHOB|nr:rcc01693 family protein [Falsigemmobacter faecalis]RRH77315.1 phage tail assembly chaperone [Falsigemmobacter faecalis]